jgi:hypothetical protein
MDVGGRAYLQTDLPLKHNGGDRPKLRWIKRGNVINDPNAMTDALCTTFDGLLDGRNTKRLARMDREVKSAVANHLERLHMVGSRVPIFWPGDIESDHAVVS